MHFHSMLSSPSTSSSSSSSYSSARSSPESLSSPSSPSSVSYSPLPSSSFFSEDQPLTSFTRPSAAPLRDAEEEFVEIRKPYTDKRQYRYISLSNKMKVLLIIDAACDEAAASIRVAAGSAADPAALPGLAHFTEHMLFQGSKRYPRHTDYFNYIHRHGGYANASTGKFSTVFSFSITPAFLQPALERMADAFAAPLLGRDQMEKEVHAVHAEYQIDTNDDARRVTHLIRQSSKETPFSRFAVGNLESLSVRPKAEGIDLQAAMRKFHDTWYSPNLMTLAVVGAPPLSKLEAFVRSRFEQIPNKNVQAPVFEECGPSYLPLAPSELRTQTFAVPEGERHEAIFVFYLPPQAKEWKEKPLQYLSFMLGHEGPGSLASKLKKENLALSFSVSSWSPELCTVFQVAVHLTEAARNGESLHRIGYLLFLFLRALAVTPPELWRLEELQRMHFLSFLFKEMPKAYDLSVDAAEGLYYFPPREVLAGDTLLYSLNVGKVRKYIDSYICPSKVRLFVFDKQFATDTDHVEPWFHIKHRVSPVPPHALQTWEELFHLPAADIMALMRSHEMHFPLRNTLIPQRLTFYNVSPRHEQQQPVVLEVKELQELEDSKPDEQQQPRHGQQQQDSAIRSQHSTHATPTDLVAAAEDERPAARSSDNSPEEGADQQEAQPLEERVEPGDRLAPSSAAAATGFPQVLAGMQTESQSRQHLANDLFFRVGPDGGTQDLLTYSCHHHRPRRGVPLVGHRRTQPQEGVAAGPAASAAHYPAELAFSPTHVCYNACSIFHKLDDSFRTPRVVVELQLYYTSSLEDPLLEQLLTDLYFDAVNLALRERLYDAAVAGISFSLRRGVSVHSSGLPLVHREKGITLFLRGYVDQLLPFLAGIAGTLAFKDNTGSSSNPAGMLDAELNTEPPAAAAHAGEAATQGNCESPKARAPKRATSLSLSTAAVAPDADVISRERAAFQPLRRRPQDATTESRSVRVPLRRSYSRLLLAQRGILQAPPADAVHVRVVDMNAVDMKAVGVGSGEVAGLLHASGQTQVSLSPTDSNSVRGVTLRQELPPRILSRLRRGKPTSFLSSEVRARGGGLGAVSVLRRNAAAKISRLRRSPLLHARASPRGSPAFFQVQRRWGRSPAAQLVEISHLRGRRLAAGSSLSLSRHAASSEAPDISDPSAFEMLHAPGMPAPPVSPPPATAAAAASGKSRSVQTGNNIVREFPGQDPLAVEEGETLSRHLNERNSQHRWRRQPRSVQQQEPQQQEPQQQEQHGQGAQQQTTGSENPEELLLAPLFDVFGMRDASRRSSEEEATATGRPATEQPEAAGAEIFEPLLQRQFLGLALERLRNGLEIATFNRSPGRQAGDAALELLLHPYTPVHALRERLQQLLREKQHEDSKDVLPALLVSIQSWAPLLWKNVAVEGLIQGNIRAGDAAAVIQALLKALPLQQIISREEIPRERVLPFGQVAAAWTAYLTDMRQADDLDTAASVATAAPYAGAAWSVLKAAASAAFCPTEMLVKAPGPSGKEEGSQPQELHVFKGAAGTPGALVSVEERPRSFVSSSLGDPTKPAPSRDFGVSVPAATETAAAGSAAGPFSAEQTAGPRLLQLSTAPAGAAFHVSAAAKPVVKDAVEETAVSRASGKAVAAESFAFPSIETANSAAGLPSAAAHADPVALPTSFAAARPPGQDHAAVSLCSVTKASRNPLSSSFAARESASAAAAAPRGASAADSAGVPRLLRLFVRNIEAAAGGAEDPWRKNATSFPTDIQAAPPPLQQKPSHLEPRNAGHAFSHAADAKTRPHCVACENPLQAARRLLRQKSLGYVRQPRSDGAAARSAPPSPVPAAAEEVLRLPGRAARGLWPQALLHENGSRSQTEAGRTEGTAAENLLQAELAERAAEETSTDDGKTSAAEKAVRKPQQAWQLDQLPPASRTPAEKVPLLGESGLLPDVHLLRGMHVHPKWKGKGPVFYAVLPRSAPIRRLQLAEGGESLRRGRSVDVNEDVQRERQQPQRQAAELQQQEQGPPEKERQQQKQQQILQQQQWERALRQLQLSKSVVERVEAAAAGLHSRHGADVRLRIRLPNWNPHDEKNQAHLFVEVGPVSSIKERALLYLVHRWMGQEFFNRMRTDEQLGYLTAMHVNRLEHTYYYLFTITTSYDPTQVAERMAHFLRRERRKFMTPQEFQHFQQAAIDVWKQQPKSLSEEVAKFHREIVVHDYVFDLDERMVEELRHLTPQSVSQFREATLYSRPWMQIEIVSQRKAPQDLAADDLPADRSLHKEAEPQWIEVNPRTTTFPAAATF